MNKNKKIFLLIAAIFLILVIVVVVDMANRTTAPWNKKKTELVPATKCTFWVFAPIKNKNYTVV
jgi:hypothetical protein